MVKRARNGKHTEASKTSVVDISTPEQPKDRIDMPHERCHNTASIGLHTPRKYRLEEL